MRIGYDASSIRRCRSGVGHYAASLLDALRSIFPDRQFLLLSHLAQTGFAGVNLLPTQSRSFPIKEIWMQLWLPRILERLRPDICHFTNSVAPLRIRVPYVVTVHDLSLIMHPEWHPWSRRIWMRRILRPSIMRASGILCDSEATMRDLFAWANVDASRSWVVPLAARESYFEARSQSDKDEIRKKYRLPRPFLLYVGNIEPRKNLPGLLEAFGKLNPPGIDLALAGRRAWQSKPVLRKASKLVAEGRVHMLDYVPEDDLPALYQSALAFVYPSLMEGFGLPVLEAMASGLPVIASDVEPLKSLVSDAGWLARPGIAQDWHAALTEAIRDSGKRVILAARGRERATLYSWEQAAKETMRCYEQVLSRPRRP
jgi:glycosyltransferase involved in cell wall biosynthesis